MRKYELFPHHCHLLWYHYPHSFFSWFRTVCMPYPMPRLIFEWLWLASFTSNIFQSSPRPPVVILKRFPPMTCVITLTYWIWRAATAAWVNIMVSDIKTNLISPKYLHCRLKEAGIQIHIINNLPSNLRLHCKVNLEVLLRPFQDLFIAIWP